MKPLNKSWMILIDITNHCGRKCSYCSRLSRHIRDDQKYHMSLDKIEQALISFQGFKGRIGIIGGEPFLHPEFDAICKLLLKYNDRSKYGVLTSIDPKGNKYEQAVKDTFAMVAFNPHTKDQLSKCKHQPLTISIDEAVEDKQYKDKLIDDCWVQKTWCSTVGDNGAFFCEIACAFDSLLGLGSGWKVEPGWWNKTPEEFQDQVDACCGLCGMALPIERELICNFKQKFSPKLLEMFRAKGLNHVEDKDVVLFDKKLSIEEIEENKKMWHPGNYRGDKVKDKPNGWKSKQPSIKK